MGIDIEGMNGELETRFTTLRLMVVCFSDGWDPSDDEIEKSVHEILLMNDKSTAEKYAKLVAMMVSQVRSIIGMMRVGVSTFGPTRDTNLVLEKLIPKKFVIYKEENTLFRSGGDADLTHYVALGNKKLLEKTLKICDLEKSLKNVIGKKGDNHGKNDN